jgi:hypothetical protein
MNAKPLLYTICVAWATWPAVAKCQEIGAAAESSITSAVPGSIAPAGTKATPAKVAMASRTQANAASMSYAEYPSPDFPHEYTGVYADGACCDESCYHGYPFDSWVRVPRLAHWGSVEYLLWWRKGEPLPPLVSNGPLDGVNDQILFGGENSDFGPQPGGRLTLGLWLDDHQACGVGGRFWALGEGNVDFERIVPPNSLGTVTRPFTQVGGGPGFPDGPNAFDIGGQPGMALGGSIDIETRSEVLGGDVLFRKRCECSSHGTLDFVFGYQFARLDEVINIQSSTTLAAGPPNLDVFDLFDATNEFHGGVLGLQADLFYGPFTAMLLAKCGLGNVNESVLISGGGNDPMAGLLGLLAQNTNAGLHRQDSFAVIPEINLNLGFQAAEHFELTFGYSLIYWSHVLRPGDAIDTTVDIRPNVAPMVNRPAFNFDATDFWVMGFNLGGSWSY